VRVADFHTYFVGGRDWSFSVWAHNANYEVYKNVYGTYSIRYWENGELKVVESAKGETQQFKTVEEADAWIERRSPNASGAGRGSQAAFSRAAEDLVSAHIRIPRNTLGKAGDTIPGSGPGGVRYPEFPVNGPDGTLRQRGSIVEVKASHSGDPSSGLSARDRVQIRDYIEYARDLRRRAAAEPDPVLRKQMANAKVELFTDYPEPTKGEFKDYVKTEGILEWKPIPRK
jgi:hypothetical protein